jgi:hypothetical protein
MADPVVFDAQVQKFAIQDSGGTERDISDYIVSITGLPGPRDLNEATTLNRSGRYYHPTLENVVVTLELVMSKDADYGTDTVFGPIRTNTSVRTFYYGPFGSTNGFPKYTGSAWVRNYSITGRVGNLITATVELQVQGTVTRTTF